MSPWKPRASTGSRCYEILEARGFDVRLVNAHHVKNVPGRKSDVSDCEWLRELHIVGLLRGSFRPTDAIVALRGLPAPSADARGERRHSHPAHAEGARGQMNVQLPIVVSDITGVTGLRILRDIVAGQRDPHPPRRASGPSLPRLEGRDHRRLTGNYRPEHVFVLQQNLELFDMCQTQLAACDRAIDAHMQTLTAERSHAH